MMSPSCALTEIREFKFDLFKILSLGFFFFFFKYLGLCP